MSQGEKINVLFLVKPERQAGAEMLLLKAAAGLNRERFRVICGLLTPDEENVLPPGIPCVNFHMSSLNGIAWLRFIFQVCWVLRKHQI